LARRSSVSVIVCQKTNPTIQQCEQDHPKRPWCPQQQIQRAEGEGYQQHPAITGHDDL
jgi:hypothetical protein